MLELAKLTLFSTVFIYIFYSKSISCQSSSLLQAYSRTLLIPDSCLNHLNQTIPVTTASANHDNWSLFSFGLIKDKPNRSNFGFGYCSIRNRYILPARGNVGPTNIGGSNAGYRNIGRDNLGPNNYGVANKGKNNCGNANHGHSIEGNFLKGSEYAELSEIFTTAKFDSNTSILSIQTPNNVENKVVYVSFRMTDFFCPSDRFKFSMAQSNSINDNNITWTPLGQSSIPKTVLSVCNDRNFADNPTSATAELSDYFSSYSSPSIRINSNIKTYIKFDWIESDFSGGAAAFKWYLSVVEPPPSCYLRRTKTVPIMQALVDGSWGMFSWGTYTVQSQQNFGPNTGDNQQGGSLNLGSNNIGNKNIGYSNVGNSNAGAFNVGNDNCGVGNLGDGIMGNYLTTEYFTKNSEDIQNGTNDETIFSLKLDSIQSDYELEVSLVDLFCPGDMFAVYYGFSVNSTFILLGNSTSVSVINDCPASMLKGDVYEALVSPNFSQATFTINVTSSVMQKAFISTNSVPKIYIRIKTTQNWGDGGIAGIKFSLTKGPIELSGCSLRNLKSAPLSPLKGDQRTWNNFVWGQYAKGSRPNWGPTSQVAPNTGHDNLGTRNVGNRNVGNDNVGDDNWGNGNRGNGNCGNGNVGDEIIGNYLNRLEFEMSSVHLPDNNNFQSTVISAEVLSSQDQKEPSVTTTVNYWNYKFTVVDLYCPGDVYTILWTDDETLKNWYKYGETSEVSSSHNLTAYCSELDENYTPDPQIALSKPDLFSQKSFYIKTEAKRIFLRFESKNNKFAGGAFSLKYSIDPVYSEPLKLPDSCGKLDYMTIPLVTDLENLWQIVPFGEYSTKDASNTKKNFLDYTDGSVNNTLTGNYGSNNVGHSNLGSNNQGSNNFGNYHVGDGNCGWNCTGTAIPGVSITSEKYAKLVQGRQRSKTAALSRMFALHFDESEWYIYYIIKFQVQDILCGGDTFSAAFTSDPFKIPPLKSMKPSSKVKINQFCTPPYYTPDPDMAMKMTTIYSQGTYSTYFWPTKKFNVLYFYLESLPFKNKRFYTLTGGSVAVRFQKSMADLPYVLEKLQQQRLEQELIEKKYQLQVE